MSILTNNAFTTDTHYVKGLFLLILTLLGNFLGETIGCQTRRVLTNNMFVKQFVILCLIYFTISFTGLIGENPIDVMKKSFILWVFFIMFTKTDFLFSSMIFIMLAITYILETFISYHIKQNTSNEFIQNLENYRNWLIIVTDVVTFVGFILYLHKQIIEHKNFDILTFIFGKRICKHI